MIFSLLLKENPCNGDGRGLLGCVILACSNFAMEYICGFKIDVGFMCRNFKTRIL